MMKKPATQSSILWAGQAPAEIYGTNNNLQTWTSHDFRNWMWPFMLLQRVVRHVITNPLGESCCLHLQSS